MKTKTKSNARSVSRKLNQMRNNAARDRHAARIAAGLLPRFRISPHGVDLVIWLADSQCRDNKEALTQWVRQQLNRPEVWCGGQPDMAPISGGLLSLLTRIHESFT